MVDITIRGAGIFGLSVAWACVRRGASVQVIDPAGVAAGASGGIVGALAPHVPENWNPKKAFQFESLLMAEGFWRDIAEMSGRNPGYVRSGRLQPIPDASAMALAEQRRATAQTLWQGRATWDILKAPEGAWQPVSPSGYLIKDTLSAHLHPRKSCEALAAALAAQGVEVRTAGADKGKVLWATGVAGLDRLNQSHSRMVGTGVKGQAVLLGYDAAHAAQLFTGGVHIIPHLDGTVAVGSTSERDYTNGATTDAQLDGVIAAACEAVPVLKDAPVLHRWAGVRPRSRSRAPMLGRLPGTQDTFIANGGFKIGFGMAPKVGEVMAGLMLDGADEIPQGFRVEDSL